MRYLLVPKGVEYYYWAGPRLGFTTIRESALRYVSEDIALLAATLVYEQQRKDWPKMRRIVVIEEEP